MHKSCKSKIHRHTRPPKNYPEPERSSTLPNSQLELIYYIGERLILQWDTSQSMP